MITPGYSVGLVLLALTGVVAWMVWELIKLAPPADEDDFETWLADEQDTWIDEEDDR